MELKFVGAFENLIVFDRLALSLLILLKNLAFYFEEKKLSKDKKQDKEQKIQLKIQLHW